MNRARLFAVLGVGGALLATASVLLLGGGGADPVLDRARTTQGAGAPAPPSSPPESVESPGPPSPTAAVVARETAVEDSVPEAARLRTAVRGRVVDGGGNPVRDAEVRLGRPLWTRSGAELFGLPMESGEKRVWIDWSTSTDARGRFEFANPTPGTQHLVRATLPDGRVGQSPRFTIGPRERVWLPPVTIGPGGRVRGELVDGEGRPLAGVLVFGTGFPSRTDTRGRFDLGAVPEGPVDVTIERTDLQLTSGVRVAARPGVPVERRVVAAPRITLCGVVVDGRGGGVKGRRVAVEMAARDGGTRTRLAEIRTDADGRFELPVPRAGRVRAVAIDREGADEASAWVDAPGEVRLVVRSEPRLRVRGRSALGGPDLVVTEVRLMNEPFGGPFFSTAAATAWRGPRGALEIEPGDESFTSVRAKAAGYWWAAAPFSEEALDPDGEVTVTFGVGAAMHVLVRTGSGRPVADAEVRVLSSAADHVRHQTDASGRATVLGLADDEYRVRVLTPRGLRLRANGVAVDDGASVTVALVLPSGGAVTGRLSDPDGSGAGGIVLALEGDHGELTARSESGGTFRFDDVPSGTYELNAVLPEARWYPFFESVGARNLKPTCSLRRLTVTADATTDASAVVPWRRPGVLRVRCLAAGRGVPGRLTLVPWVPGEDGVERRDDLAKSFGVGPAGVMGLPRVAPLRYAVLVEPAEAGGARFDGGEVEVEPSARTESVVRLGGSHPLEGRVEDASTGAPIPKARVRLLHPNGLAAAKETRSGRDGRFRFAAAPEATLDLVISVGDRPPLVRRIVVDSATASLVIAVP